MALVEVANMEEVGSWVAGGDGVLGGVGDSRSVIIEDRDGGFSDVMLLGRDVLVSHDTSKFKVTVREVTRGVCHRDKMLNNVVRERFSPQERITPEGEPDATHTTSRGIDGTNCSQCI